MKKKEKEKLHIYQVMECNKVLFKLIQQQSTFPFSIGFKIFQLSKKFDEVEEYVFNLMEDTFEDFNFKTMTDNQKMFYSSVLSSEIELEYEKIPMKFFEQNDDLKLTVEDIEKMMIILEKEN